MATRVTIVLVTGQVINALNYRMDSSAPAAPSVPASPHPYIGGVFHVQTPDGWIDINASQVQSITLKPGAVT